MFNHLFVICSLVILNYCCFAGIHQILMNQSVEYIRLSQNKQKYVIKNLTKSIILFFLIFLTIPCLWNMIFYDIWDNHDIHLLGTIYVSTDLSGLLFVPDLPMTTIIHHCSVLVIGCINILMDYNQPGLHRAFISLTILSMIPYLVNTFLAMRYLENTAYNKNILYICLGLYSTSVMLNVCLQHYHVFFLVPRVGIYYKALYLLLYYTILNDDIKLIRYLGYKYQGLS